MEFAKPLLLLTRLSLKIFQVTPSANLNWEDAQAQSCTTPGASGFQTDYSNVFTMRKSRTRSKAARAPAASAAQMALPLQHSDQAPTEPRTLKIVQREPRKQPECLLISGRMADVCAALERMARNERALQA